MTKFMGGGDSRLAYYGGEFIGITSEIVNRLLDEFDYLWNENYKRYEKNRIKLNEEAHFLSLLYYRLGIHNNLGNRHIRRMWTALKCDTIQKMDMELPIWHLPAEKKYGFERMFEWFRDNNSCTTDEYLLASDEIMGISSSRTKRAVKKIIAKTKERLKQ